MCFAPKNPATMKEVKQLLEKMRKAQLDKDTKNAVSYLQAATKRLDLLAKQSPDDASFHLKKAELYISINAHKFAEKDLLKAISIDPQNARTLYMLGKVYLKTSSFKLAAEAYDKFFLLDESNPCGIQHATVYFERAIARNGLYWYDEALDDLEKVAVLQPKMPQLEQSIATIKKNKAAAQ